MKSSIFLLSLFFSSHLLAEVKVPCQSEAYKAIYERYSYESPDSIVSLSSSKYKPYLRDGEAVFFVSIADLESGQQTLMTAIMDAATCKVKAIN